MFPHAKSADSTGPKLALNTVDGWSNIGLILTPFQVEQQRIRAGHPIQSAAKVRALPGWL